MNIILSTYHLTLRFDCLQIFILFKIKEAFLGSKQTDFVKNEFPWQYKTSTLKKCPHHYFQKLRKNLTEK